uniref:Uncharacterized protein n=1 Tax=Anguilla anguilla TaxID=7936 RepID=A0A0E9SXV3_ANGAN
MNEEKRKEVKMPVLHFELGVTGRPGKAKDLTSQHPKAPYSSKLLQTVPCPCNQVKYQRFIRRTVHPQR